MSSANPAAIRTIRRLRDFSIRRLAEIARVDDGNLTRIENGQRGAGEDILARLAEALSTDDVLVPPEALSCPDPGPAAPFTLNLTRDQAAQIHAEYRADIGGAA